MIKKLIVPFLFVIIMSSCSASTPVPENSGIEGRVFIGPMCPVVRQGQECPDRPYPATVRVTTTHGKEIVRFQTDEDGFFHIPLSPGEYILHPESTSPFPYAQEQRILIEDGIFTLVTINYDSGIR